MSKTLQPCRGIPFGYSMGPQRCGACHKPIRRMSNGTAEHVPQSDAEKEAEDQRLHRALSILDDVCDAAKERGDKARRDRLFEARQAIYYTLWPQKDKS